MAIHSPHLHVGAPGFFFRYFKLCSDAKEREREIEIEIEIEIERAGEREREREREREVRKGTGS